MAQIRSEARRDQQKPATGVSAGAGETGGERAADIAADGRVLWGAPFGAGDFVSVMRRVEAEVYDAA